MAVRDDRGDVKQTTTGFRDPRHLIYQKQIPIPHVNPFVFLQFLILVINAVFQFKNQLF